MEFIGTKRLKEEINRRLVSPNDFASRSLVLWGSTARSIVERIVGECCLNYYKTVQPAEGCWYRYVYPDESLCNLDNIEFVELRDDFLVENRYVQHRKGIVLTDSWDLCYPQKEVADFINLVNTHRNGISHLSSEWVFVACVQPGKLDSLTPESFDDNCDQYFFVPDFDEWAACVINNYGAAAKIVVEYIRGDNNPLNILKKFFVPVTATKGHTSECTFFDAYFWNAIIEWIAEHEDVNNLCIGNIRRYIAGITSNLKTTLGDDFCDYLIRKYY